MKNINVGKAIDCVTASSTDDGAQYTAGTGKLELRYQYNQNSNHRRYI